MKSVPGLSRVAVFLDRDGTINRTFEAHGEPKPPKDLGQLEILPGVSDALTRLKQAGLLLIVVTNQPDVARRATRREVVEAIHSSLRRSLPLDAVYCCYHDDPDDCACRKPRPGMLTRAAEQFGVLLSASFVVGDRWKDVEAGRRAGCTTVLLEAAYSGAERTRPDHVAAGLPEAAEIILRLLDGAQR